MPYRRARLSPFRAIALQPLPSVVCNQTSSVQWPPTHNFALRACCESGAATPANRFSFRTTQKSLCELSLRSHKLLYQKQLLYWHKAGQALFMPQKFYRYSNTAIPNALVSRYPSFVEQLQLRIPVRLPAASASFICTSKPIIVPAAAEILSSGQATSTM